MEDKKDNAPEMTIEEAFQALDAILSSSEPAGRKLDFLLQEMNRETNTIGSKANNAEIFTKYQKGLEYVKFLKERIDGIEKKLIILESGEENVG